MLYEIKLMIKEYATIHIYTESELLKNKLVDNKSSIKRTIPITNVTSRVVTKQDIIYKDTIIIQSNSNKKRMFYDKEDNVSYLEIVDDLRFPDLVYISLSMFSKILAREDKYLLHSSSLLSPSNAGFILVGDANAGKTSLAYELMSRHNCKLISNDHSIIGLKDDKAYILGGTKEIQMRLGAIELYFPELYEKINMKSDDKWNKKIIVNEHIDQYLLLNDTNDVAYLDNVFSISTTKLGDSFIRVKDEVDEFLFLYESMSKIIKGTYNYITGFDYPMPSMEDEKTLYNLSNLCKVITKQCDVCEAKGSVDGLAKVLVKNYGK